MAALFIFEDGGDGIVCERVYFDSGNILGSSLQPDGHMGVMVGGTNGTASCNSRRGGSPAVTLNGQSGTHPNLRHVACTQRLAALVTRRVGYGSVGKRGGLGMRERSIEVIRPAGVLALSAIMLPAAPAEAAAAPPPPFKAPWGCNLTWHTSTYSGHGNAVDFNGFPEDAGMPVLASLGGRRPVTLRPPATATMSTSRTAEAG